MGTRIQCRYRRAGWCHWGRLHPSPSPPRVHQLPGGAGPRAQPKRTGASRTCSPAMVQQLVSSPNPSFLPFISGTRPVGSVSFTDEHSRVCVRGAGTWGAAARPHPVLWLWQRVQVTTPGTSSVPSTSALPSSSSMEVPLSSAQGTGRIWKALRLCAVFMSVCAH